MAKESMRGAIDERTVAGDDEALPDTSGASESFDPLMRWGLFVVAICSVAAAVLHYFDSSARIRIDKTTAMLLGLAAAALVFHEISKFEFFGIKGELRVRNEVRRQVKPVVTRVNLIEDQGMLPGRPQVDARTATTARPVETTAEGRQRDGDWDADPNKGKFGGASEVNQRRLSATVRPAAGPESAACAVVLRIETTDTSKPLTGKVTLHLHPTFGRYAKYDIDVVDGTAEEEIISWGAFTIGAVADGGSTKLELDLMNVRGGTDKFYSD